MTIMRDDKRIAFGEPPSPFALSRPHEKEDGFVVLVNEEKSVLEVRWSDLGLRLRFNDAEHEDVRKARESADFAEEYALRRFLEERLIEKEPRDLLKLCRYFWRRGKEKGIDEHEKEVRSTLRGLAGGKL